MTPGRRRQVSGDRGPGSADPGIWWGDIWLGQEAGLAGPLAALLEEKRRRSLGPGRLVVDPGGAPATDDARTSHGRTEPDRHHDPGQAGQETRRLAPPDGQARPQAGPRVRRRLGALDLLVDAPQAVEDESGGRERLLAGATAIDMIKGPDYGQALGPPRRELDQGCSMLGAAAPGAQAYHGTTSAGTGAGAPDGP